MADEKIFEKQILTVDIDCNEDISTASGYKIYVKKPDRTLEILSSGVTINGTTQLRYTFGWGILVQARYELMPFMTLGTWKGWGKPVEINVLPLFS